MLIVKIKGINFENYSIFKDNESNLTGSDCTCCVTQQTAKRNWRCFHKEFVQMQNEKKRIRKT